MSQRLEFRAGVPVEVTLAAPGELVAGTWKDVVVYQLQSGQTMYLESDVAASVNQMEIQPGEKFFVCKYFVDAEKKQPAWNVWLAPETEKARAAKEAPEIERQLRESIDQAQARRNGHSGKFGNSGRNGNNGAARGAGVTSIAAAPPARLSAAPDHTPEETPAAEQSAMLHFPWCQFLLSQTEALADVYAALLAYSSRRHGNTVKPEDLRTLLVTAFINLRQNGGANVA